MGSTSQKTIEVGILLADSVSFQLEGNFGRYSGSYEVSLKENRLFFDGMLYDALCFAPDSQACSFVLKDVVIGIDFHWERKEDERFKGALRFIPEKGKVRAINSLSVEDYLISVIASEMSATSTPEYLKAHAVISRSWLLSQIEKKHGLQKQEAVRFNSDLRTPDEWIKWWDREDHDLFDVCADDHCQRYQGITRPSLAFENVKKAVEGTRGEVLTSGGTICDARFSKCCGGFMETFPTSWEPVEYSYLQGNYDGESFPEDIPVPDLTQPVQAEVWIRSEPPAFCNTADETVLSQVLNSYDRETKSFYRWKVKYTFEEVTDLVRRRIGEDFGLITDLIPVERGKSGRICRLKIVGTHKALVIGKDLLIRKALSESHLYSSAFVVEKNSKGFTLFGAGWGHGVGFCQIGGAVMASKGYPYKDILKHYFPTAGIEKIY